MKVFGYICAFILAIVAIIGITIALDLGSLFYKQGTASVRGKSGAEVRIESAPSRINNYERFYNLCMAIQKKEDAIDILRANDSMVESRKDMALTANQTQRANLIGDYNAQSRKQDTAARFKASDLPYEIKRGAYDGDNSTSCTG